MRYSKEVLKKYLVYILLVGASLIPMGILIYMPKPTWISADYIIAVSGLLYFIVLTIIFVAERERINNRIEGLERKSR